METTNNYVYILLNPLKKGIYKYNEYSFEYEPFYVGISNTESYYIREDMHTNFVKNESTYAKNRIKNSIIKKILKNNMEPISIRIIENLSREIVCQEEIRLIELIGTKIEKSGPLSNISKGGDGGDTFTNNPRKEEIREKHRLNAIGENNNMYGLPLEKRPSHIAKLNGNHWNKGRIISEETRNIFKEINKGEGNPRSKKTLLFDKDFNLIKEFDYCFAISDYLDSSNRAVAKTARTNSTKEIPYHTTKGYFIIYKDDWENKFKEKEDEIRKFLKTFVKKQKSIFIKKIK
jgi:hypothetical protein